MEALRGEMEKVQEVGQVLTEVGGEAVDEGEVEGELEELERVERERREVGERKERERREEEEASRMKERLAELEKLGTLKQVEKVGEQREQEEVEKGLEESVEELGRMSLDEARPVQTEERHEKEEVLAA